LGFGYEQNCTVQLLNKVSAAGTKGNTAHSAEKFQLRMADSSRFRDYSLADERLDAAPIEFREKGTKSGTGRFYKPGTTKLAGGRISHLGCARRAIASLVFPRSKT
jgi:hypothetical protein